MELVESVDSPIVNTTSMAGHSTVVDPVAEPAVVSVPVLVDQAAGIYSVACNTEDTEAAGRDNSSAPSQKTTTTTTKSVKFNSNDLISFHVTPAYIQCHCHRQSILSPPSSPRLAFSPRPISIRLESTFSPNSSSNTFPLPLRLFPSRFATTTVTRRTSEINLTPLPRRLRCSLLL